MSPLAVIVSSSARILDFVQSTAGDSSGVVLSENTPESLVIGDFWNLVEQAGPLRWPIFVVLAIGLILVISKLYELLKDRSLSRPLFDFDFRSVSLAEIAGLVSQQSECMIASLQSAMLNVFQTRPSEGMLHDEIVNFVSFQQDQFAVFKGRMAFLADTAGALGLMGTVWGMFEVFFQGTSDKDVILRGMGIALITTLLGLVVSIILNLCATELATFFGKRLEQVSKKSDELRFRLLELAFDVVPPGEVQAPEPVRRFSSPEPRAVHAPRDSDTDDKANAVSQNPWLYLEADASEYVATAGETLRDLCLRLQSDNGQRSEGVTIKVVVPPNSGTLDGGGREARWDADDEGRVRFDWTAPEEAGTFFVEASILGQPGSCHRVNLRVEPGAPSRVELEGNNQAAVAGMRLPKPLILRALDRFDNPVAGVAVSFKVQNGHGTFGRSSTEVSSTTDSNGVATAPFAVSSEAGPNVVVATVEGQDDRHEFLAFGTEV